jgi:AcrR family transcriptional regulator
MKDRKDKIIDVAVTLAERGGFDRVRQREVAASAGVALGTLYKTFRSKEDILTASIDREAAMLEARLETKPIQGKSGLDRVTTFFTLVTRGLVAKPKYARAVLRAMASGEPEVAGKVAQFHERMARLIVTAMRGGGPNGTSKKGQQKELELAFLLQQFWFASLVGWSAGLHGPDEVVVQVRRAAELLIRGLDLKS